MAIAVHLFASITSKFAVPARGTKSQIFVFKRTNIYIQMNAKTEYRMNRIVGQSSNIGNFLKAYFVSSRRFCQGADIENSYLEFLAIILDKNPQKSLNATKTIICAYTFSFSSFLGVTVPKCLLYMSYAMYLYKYENRREICKKKLKLTPILPCISKIHIEEN